MENQEEISYIGKIEDLTGIDLKEPNISIKEIIGRLDRCRDEKCFSAFLAAASTFEIEGKAKEIDILFNALTGYASRGDIGFAVTAIKTFFSVFWTKVYVSKMISGMDITKSSAAFRIISDEEMGIFSSLVFLLGKEALRQISPELLEKAFWKSLETKKEVLEKSLSYIDESFLRILAFEVVVTGINSFYEFASFSLADEKNIEKIIEKERKRNR